MCIASCDVLLQVASESEDMDEDFLRGLLDMTAVQRADLIAPGLGRALS